MSSLSPRQRRILSFLREYIEEHGYPPSLREIGRACGISSTSVVDFNLKALEREGYIRRDPEISRGIELVRGERARVRRVPILGRIAAGEPLPVLASDSWASLDPEDFIEVPEELTRGRRDIYALVVRGNSMIDALINDGDIVLLQPAQTADNGDLVAVWLRREKETTLKRIYRENDRIRLQPANSEMQPIYVDPEDVEVQGRVTGVIRRL